MKFFVASALCSVVVFSNTLAFGQGQPSGPGSITGDPAASSAKPTANPTAGSSNRANPSGSATSTSGGKDDNGDQGRDKMPESGNKPSDKSNKQN